MEWARNRSLKRTRNGVIYSERPRATKRPRTSEPASSNRCILEELPAELLAQIFLTSMNGNLLIASPRAAVKLSGSWKVYHASFLIAFYGHDLYSMFDMFDIFYLAPMISSPSSWEIRSMTHAVLNSGWCTWGLCKALLRLNLEIAAYDLQKSCDVDSESIEEFMNRGIDVEDLIQASWSGDTPEGDFLELETNVFDLRLTNTPKEFAYRRAIDFLDDDSNHEDWPREEVEWHCQLRILGTITLVGEKFLDLVPEDFDNSDPFRDVFRYMIEMPAKTQPHRDPWLILEEKLYCAVYNKFDMRETLAVDYFFTPESAPYKISPRLYREAARRDLELERELPTSTRFSKDANSLVHTLFYVDPASLPATDPAMIRWAYSARSRVLAWPEHMDRLHREAESLMEERGGEPTEKDLHRSFLRWSEEKYIFKTDVAVLRYMKTGCLRKKPNQFSPSFREPLPHEPHRTTLSAQIADFGTEDGKMRCIGPDQDSYWDMEEVLSDSEIERETESDPPNAMPWPLNFLSVRDYDRLCRNADVTPYELLYHVSPFRNAQLKADEHDESGHLTLEDEYWGRYGRIRHVGLSEEYEAVDWDLVAPGRRGLPEKDTELLISFEDPPKWFVKAHMNEFFDLATMKSAPRRRVDDAP